MLRAAGDIWVIAAVLRTLAMIAFDEEDYGKARAYSVESLTQLREMDERWQIIHTLEVFARLATVEGQQPNDGHLGFVRSARLFGSAEALREIFGAAMIVANERRFNERGIAALRAQLDEVTLAAAWAEGRAMTLEQVVAYALEG